MKLPFNRVTVHTGEGANHFTVYVNDLERVLEYLRKKESAMELARETNVLALERALFIQQAIEEKLERERLAQLEKR